MLFYSLKTPSSERIEITSYDYLDKPHKNKANQQIQIRLRMFRFFVPSTIMSFINVQFFMDSAQPFPSTPSTCEFQFWPLNTRFIYSFIFICIAVSFFIWNLFDSHIYLHIFSLYRGHRPLWCSNWFIHFLSRSICSYQSSDANYVFQSLNF